MAINGQVQTQIADDYLKQFDRSLGVAGIKKLSRFPMLQALGYNGQLGLMKDGFHGLQDFKAQLDAYSSTSIILESAWQVIKSIVPNNPLIALKLFSGDPALGTVGNLFSSISNFGQVFALSPEVLSSPAQTKSVISSVVSGNAGF